MQLTFKKKKQGTQVVQLVMIDGVQMGFIAKYENGFIWHWGVLDLEVISIQEAEILILQTVEQVRGFHEQCQMKDVNENFKVLLDHVHNIVDGKFGTPKSNFHLHKKEQEELFVKENFSKENHDLFVTLNNMKVLTIKKQKYELASVVRDMERKIWFSGNKALDDGLIKNLKIVFAEIESSIEKGKFIKIELENEINNKLHLLLKQIKTEQNV